MPMPRPNSGESQQKFVDRFMSDPAMNQDYPDRTQRYAVCMQQWRSKNRVHNSVYMELQANTAGAVRQTTFEGRDHVVVPVVLLVEGVHRGSGGPLYYSPQEIQNSAMFWNGMPLPVYHPEQNGQAVSCNSPEVTEARSIGRVWNVRYESSPKPRLVGEAWIDVVKAQAISPETLQKINAGEPIEVSTGLFSREEAVPGVWNTETYQAVVKDIRPDHLAILPGSVGACSLADGCGIRYNQGEGEQMEEQERGFFSTMLSKANSLLQRIMGNELSLDGKMSAIRRAIYAMDGPTQDNSVEAVFDTYVIYTTNPGPQSPAGISSKMYKRGYSVDGQGNVTLANDVQEVNKVISYNPVTNESEERPNGDGVDTKLNLQTDAGEGSHSPKRNEALSAAQRAAKIFKNKQK